MQKKPNESFIDQYKLGFSKKVAEEFFQRKDQITGQEILGVTASKQINFFVLKILFAKWQEEMKRLESPYFDFKDAEVRKGLISFMNVLSKKISMDQTHFEGLLAESVGQTLKLLVSPADFLKTEFEGKEDVILSDKNARNFLKYIKVFKEEIGELLSDHADSSIGGMLEDAVGYFETLDLKDAILAELQVISAVEPVAFSDLMEGSDEVKEEEDDFDFSSEDMEEPVAEAGEVESVEVEEDSDEQWAEEKEEAFEPEETQSDEEESVDNEEEPEVKLEEGSSSVEKEEVTDTEEIKAQDTEEDDTEDEPEASKPLNESIASDSTKTVNDSFEKEEKVSLAESHAQSKVSSIMQAISVNSRYMFVKELFDDEREVFEEAMEMLEGCSSFDDAVELLVQDYAKTYEWDMNSDEVKELLKVVFRKFR